MTKSEWEDKYLKSNKVTNYNVMKGELFHSLLEQQEVDSYEIGMSEQKILEKLCFYIMIVKGNPLDNSFFNHCYDICVGMKDKMTDVIMWEIVDREYTLALAREREFIDNLKMYIK